jgi:SecD/SecF fusion protein
MLVRFKSPLSGFSCWIVIGALLVGLAGCGSDDPQPVGKRDACGTKVRTLDGPTTTLTYRGSDDVVADVGPICARLRGLKVAHQVQGLGRDRLVITVPSKAVKGAEAAAATGRLVFYDWEANVIGPSGKPAPADPKVTGAANAGRTGSLEHYDAVLRASKRPADVEPDNARKASIFYAVHPQAGKVYGSGSPTRAAALAVVPATERAQAKAREVKAGTVVVGGEQAVDDPAPGRFFFVLRDDVALRGSEIEHPEQNFANGPGGSGEPTVTFEFSAKGVKAFQKLTRALADRGARSVGVLPGQSAVDANQHFAIVLDGRIVSIPYIDFRANPKGIDGSTGSQIQGGFTIASARQLASILSSGELEVPLVLVANKAG